MKKLSFSKDSIQKKMKSQHLSQNLNNVIKKMMTILLVLLQAIGSLKNQQIGMVIKLMELLQTLLKQLNLSISLTMQLSNLNLHLLQMITSHAYGKVLSKLKKVVNILSKLSQMMGQDYGSTIKELSITGVYMELKPRKELLTLKKVITNLRQSCLKTTEEQL